MAAHILPWLGSTGPSGEGGVALEAWVPSQRTSSAPGRKRSVALAEVPAHCPVIPHTRPRPRSEQHAPRAESNGLVGRRQLKQTDSLSAGTGLFGFWSRTGNA